MSIKLCYYSNRSPLDDYCEEFDCRYAPIPDFPGYYAFDDGRIYSEKSHKFLASRDNGKGYQIVRLSKNNKQFCKTIHRLVAEAFVPNDNPEHKTEVDHIDGDKTNNRADNLQWLSHTENVRKSSCKPVMLFDTLSGDVE